MLTRLEKQLADALAFAAGFIAACQEQGCPAGPVAVPSRINDALDQARRIEAAQNCQIITDARTVWVNSREGWCIARFSKLGIDIHTAVSQDGRVEQECLYCTHDSATRADWKSFQEALLNLYGIEVPDTYMPLYLKFSLASDDTTPRA